MSEENAKPKTGVVGSITQSERLRNYAGAIAILLGALPAIGSLVVSLVTTYRGEPVAEKTWETLREQQNRQGEVVNKLHNRVVYLQAYQEGQNVAALQSQLEELQKKYDDLKSTISEPTKVSVTTDCGTGRVRIAGRCRSTSKAVADLVKARIRETEEVKKKLVREKVRRIKSEVQKSKIQQTVKRAPPDPIQPLPKNLDDAAKAK